jgi:hypothetical protein
MLYLDAASSFWREWVINYDFQHQRAVGQQATNSSRQLFERARIWGQEHYDALLGSARRLRQRMLGAPKAWTFAGVCTVLVILVMINGRAVWSMVSARQLASHPGRAPQRAASIWYQRMTRTLARDGWRKLPTQTPSEFARSIDDTQLYRAVEEFTDSYHKARFAESIKDAERLPELYDEIDAVRRS